MENSIHALIFNHDKVKLVGREYADFFINNNLRILSLNHVEEFSGDENGDDKGANISTHVKNVQIEDLLGRDPIVLDNSLVRSNIRGSVVMITGACGSIGSEIVRQVATYKAKKIILVDQAETPMHDMALEMKEKFPKPTSCSLWATFRTATVWSVHSPNTVHDSCSTLRHTSMCL